MKDLKVKEARVTRAKSFHKDSAQIPNKVHESLASTSVLDELPISYSALYNFNILK